MPNTCHPESTVAVSYSQAHQPAALLQVIGFYGVELILHAFGHNLCMGMS